MRVCKCDRCGREITMHACRSETFDYYEHRFETPNYTAPAPDYWEMTLTGSGLDTNRIDLCANCAQVIFDTINNFKKEN